MSAVDPTIDEAYELLTNTMTNIANSIRTKNGTVGDIDASDFSDEISDIVPGGDMEYSDYDGFNYLIKSITGTVGITKAIYDQYIYPIVSDKTTYPSVCFYLTSENNTNYLHFMYKRDGGSLDFTGIYIDYYYTSRSYFRYQHTNDNTDRISVINLKKVGTDIDTYESTNTLYKNGTGCEFGYYITLLAKFDYTHLYR